MCYVKKCLLISLSLLGGVWSLIVQESRSDVSPVLRPLNLDDFIQSKAKVKNLSYIILLFLSV